MWQKCCWILLAGNHWIWWGLKIYNRCVTSMAPIWFWLRAIKSDCGKTPQHGDHPYPFHATKPQIAAMGFHQAEELRQRTPWGEPGCPDPFLLGMGLLLTKWWPIKSINTCNEHFPLKGIHVLSNVQRSYYINYDIQNVGRTHPLKITVWHVAPKHVCFNQTMRCNSLKSGMGSTP